MKEYAQPLTDYRGKPRQIVRGPREQCSIDELRGTPNFEHLLKLAEKVARDCEEERKLKVIGPQNIAVTVRMKFALKRFRAHRSQTSDYCKLKRSHPHTL
jgi:hypothetical protein